MKDVMGAENEDCDGDCEHCDHHDKEMAGMKEKMGGKILKTLSVN